jgi:hypothetical protein
MTSLSDYGQGFFGVLYGQTMQGSGPPSKVFWAT